MIKRTIEISNRPAHLKVRYDQLIVRQEENGEVKETSIPCEDIGVLVVDQTETTYTHKALSTLMDSGAAVVLCGQNHLPAGMILPMTEHSEVVWRIQEQISIGKPLCKQLWQQLVQAKVSAQARNLIEGTPEHTKLLRLEKEVRSGDPSNIEAQAAKVYWSAWLGEEDSFRRNPRGKDGLNSLLNYGYAIVRAGIARAIVAAGLLPSIGLHHSHRSNAFCLADDLIEPLRPLVDERVRELYRNGTKQIEPAAKKFLLELLTKTVKLDEQKGPLLIAFHRMAASLVNCIEGKEKKLLIPVAVDE
jgi:CRISPR-associated protein Cas1